MSIRMPSYIRATVTVVMAIAVLATAFPTVSQADDLTMSPSKIVLNAKGAFESVQAVIRTPMAPGYTLSDYQVTLSFNSITVSEAFDLRYCYIDDNFLASFDRTALQVNPDVVAMTNTTVTATIDGWYTAVADDGSSYTQALSGTDMVEIVDPDKK